MRIKNGYLVREIAGNHIVVPIGERAIEFKGIMTLNEVGSLIWRSLEKNMSKDEILKLILDEYEIDEATANSDLEEFLETIRESGALEE